jgi:hypothetical protein
MMAKVFRSFISGDFLATDKWTIFLVRLCFFVHRLFDYSFLLLLFGTQSITHSLTHSLITHLIILAFTYMYLFAQLLWSVLNCCDSGSETGLIVAVRVWQWGTGWLVLTHSLTHSHSATSSSALCFTSQWVSLAPARTPLHSSRTHSLTHKYVVWHSLTHSEGAGVHSCDVHWDTRPHWCSAATASLHWPPSEWGSEWSSEPWHFPHSTTDIFSV